MKNQESYIELYSDKTFHFIPHIAANYSLYGDYNIEKEILKLNSQSGEYEFDISDNKIIFKERDDLTNWEIKKGSEFFYEKK